MNNTLLAIFTKEAVEAALKQMAPLKSLRLDGFNHGFYQKYWYIVGNLVSFVVLNFLNNGIFDNCINYSFIVLIPKVKHLICPSDFRPISLCNMIYKLVSKVLSNRLKQILSLLISKNQSTFMLGRLITDNVITAYEALHSMKTRHKGRKGIMTIKLDISKEYDKLEWPFLKAMMRSMGFDEGWIMRLMRCVTIVSYATLINGHP